MKKLFSWLLKAFAAGLLAFVVLTLFCTLYYNVPVHYSNTDGSTDYSWEKNKFYSRGTEGFACGRTNNEGYLNTYDYLDGMDIDVLIMGSSHIEAYNVSPSESTSCRLDALLEDETIYNIGMSGHNFLVCSNNLEHALKKYKPRQYVIIETSILLFDENAVENAAEGTMDELPSYSGGIIGMLQKNQFLRLLYSQFSNWKPEPKHDNATNLQPLQLTNTHKQSYLKLLNKLSQTAADYGVQLIVLYHSNIQIDSKTGKALKDSSEFTNFFAAYCETTGITFVDMSERFKAEYDEKHILPHGFANTSIGTGHLNKHGHRMIAEELFEIIGSEDECHLHH
ncbi:MAG: hypothetical protein E7625_02345 [Ruminococcaceae bacterium]|nr:hypothetical protein [Oscillospiraceae bacterium]